MSTFEWVMSVLGALLLLAFGTALGDLLSEEIRGWLDRVPYGLLRLAARRMPCELRNEHMIGWTGELHEFLRGAEARPLLRLFRGVRFAGGLFWSAGSIAEAFGLRANGWYDARNAASDAFSIFGGLSLISIYGPDLDSATGGTFVFYLLMTAGATFVVSLSLSLIYVRVRRLRKGE